VIDQVDGRLKTWVETVLAGTPISFGPPHDPHFAGGVSLYLMELCAPAPGRSDTRRTHEVWLRYLVTAWADEPQEAHRLLGTLVFAAMEDAELEVELQPLPGTVWAAFGGAPRPSFVLQAPLRRERPQAPVRQVRKRLRIDLVTTSPLQGIVLGPDDLPLAGARVDLPKLHLACYTDLAGQFRFPRVPTEPQAKEVRVTAKGRRMDVAVQQPVAADEPLLIRFDALDQKEG
jgi:hypothetical protein